MAVYSRQSVEGLDKNRFAMDGVCRHWCQERGCRRYDVAAAAGMRDALSCKLLHPRFMWGRDVLFGNLCHKFSRGACDRVDCRHYHATLPDALAKLTAQESQLDYIPSLPLTAPATQRGPAVAPRYRRGGQDLVQVNEADNLQMALSRDIGHLRWDLNDSTRTRAALFAAIGWFSPDFIEAGDLPATSAVLERIRMYLNSQLLQIDESTENTAQPSAFASTIPASTFIDC